MDEKQFEIDLDFRERPEKTLYDWLHRNAYGLANARKADEISAALHMTPRQIAEVKSKAVISFHLTIGSTTTDGYFIPNGEAEREIGGWELKAKALRMLQQYAAYKKISDKEAVKEITKDLFEGE